MDWFKGNLYLEEGELTFIASMIDQIKETAQRFFMLSGEEGGQIPITFNKKSSRDVYFSFVAFIPIEKFSPEFNQIIQNLTEMPSKKRVKDILIRFMEERIFLDAYEKIRDLGTRGMEPVNFELSRPPVPKGTFPVFFEGSFEIK